MTAEVWGMVGAGVAALVAGLVFVRTRMAAATGAGQILLLGPVCEAAALAVFAAEHFFAARDLASIVPHWLPAPLFWAYFVGAALLAASISFIAWRQVRWSAALLSLLFLIIVATIDVPNLPMHLHERLFWTLTVREMALASGAMVLAGSVWPRGAASIVLVRLGRGFVTLVMIFYAIEHFLFPRNVPGVPLEKLTPAWMPAPVLISYVVGIALLLGGIGLFFRPATRIAAAGAGSVLLLLTVFFYVPIFVTEMHGTLAVEGMNYVGDTLLWAATVLLAGFGADRSAESSVQSVHEGVPSESVSLPEDGPVQSV